MPHGLMLHFCLFLFTKEYLSAIGCHGMLGQDRWCQHIFFNECFIKEIIINGGYFKTGVPHHIWKIVTEYPEMIILAK